MFGFVFLSRSEIEKNREKKSLQKDSDIVPQRKRVSDPGQIASAVSDKEEKVSPHLGLS